MGTPIHQIVPLPYPCSLSTSPTDGYHILQIRSCHQFPVKPTGDKSCSKNKRLNFSIHQVVPFLYPASLSTPDDFRILQVMLRIHPGKESSHASPNAEQGKRETPPCRACTRVRRGAGQGWRPPSIARLDSYCEPDVTLEKHGKNSSYFL